MNIPHEFTDSLPQELRERFIYWDNYMYRHISFSLTESEIHTKRHCERVLLFAMLILWKKGDTSEMILTQASHAAIFHDTRRMDDGLDKGHGARAAIYYKKFCSEHPEIKFSETAYQIMRFHDQDDSLGLREIASLFSNSSERDNVANLYRVFKDADALDRFRLGDGGLDPKFLRNKESVELIDFARKLVMNTL